MRLDYANLKCFIHFPSARCKTFTAQCLKFVPNKENYHTQLELDEGTGGGGWDGLPMSPDKIKIDLITTTHLEAKT